MSSLIINIPDDIREVVASEAEQQGLSLQAYIEKILQVKAFSSVLNKLRSKTTPAIQENNIQDENALMSYLKK
ncbi:MAG: hypothetical protein C0459_12325 [Chitinophaga sp.]|jgi:hypothetical protein|nr:hypothetical protein [Chitinophaga sp.]